jgi:hypothetical protein
MAILGKKKYENNLGLLRVACKVAFILLALPFFLLHVILFRTPNEQKERLGRGIHGRKSDIPLSGAWGYRAHKNSNMMYARRRNQNILTSASSWAGVAARQMIKEQCPAM